MPADELTAEVLYQIAALDGIARTEGGRVGYVKPHGALYNRRVRDPVQAAAIAAAVRAYDAALPLLTCPAARPRGPATDARADRGRRGVRRPGLPVRRHAGAARPARRGD